ncbi:MAG: PAS domain S-box protein [Firmicutes bacterium]|nr:PAS domain S-box protein [Bacillota bacterium]
MLLWGIAWIAYTVSLVILLAGIRTESELFLQLREVADVANLLLLLFGSYHFTQRRTPSYWFRFSLYILLLALIFMIYRFQLLSYYLPISIFQTIIAVFICVNIARTREISAVEARISGLVFLLWGLLKATLPVVVLFYPLSEAYLVLAEVLFSILVNFCILTMYIPYSRTRTTLTDSLYRSIVEHSRGAVFYYQFKPEPLFSYVSPSIRELTGYSPEEFRMDPRLLFTMTAKPFAEDIRDLFENRLKRDEYPALELFRKDGEKFWCEFSCTFLRDEEGEPTGMIGSMRDVTNLKTEEVEKVNDIRRRNILLSYISHELRTPITSIAGYLTAIQDGIMSSDEEKQEAMEIITDKTMTLKKLIDDLDQLAKFETNQFTFNFESCDLGAVIDSLISRNVPDLEQDGFIVTIEQNLEHPEDYRVVIDPDRINQVLSNLLNNAVKYSGDSRRIHLKFTLDERKDYFIVFVRDEGIGIPEEQISHVFDRFFRVGYNGSITTEGRGLGLTLSKEIIEAHQGEIYVESARGKGSTFSFMIPLYKEE